LTDFDEIWHDDAVRPLDSPDRQKFGISKIQDGGRRHLGKIEKLSYLSRGSTDFDEIWLRDAVRAFWPFRPLKN